MNRPITVLGAGIVGISCAFELRRRGFRVTLVDRRGPGEETSAGNAGIFSYGSITPLADPALWSRLHRLLLNRDADFLLHYPHLPSLLPWLLRFLLRCRRQTYFDDGIALGVLVRASIELHKQWMAPAGLQTLLNRDGVLQLYRKRQSFEAGRLQRELLQRCGIKHTDLSAEQIYELEPDLNRVFTRSLLIDESMSLRNPEKLCKAYARCFVEAGGQLIRDEVRALRPADGGWELVTAQATRAVEKLVVCLGAWTPGLIGELGYANPLAIERGYHTLAAPAPGNKLSGPVFDADAGYVMVPMEMGLRVSTGTNLTQREARPDTRQIKRVLPRLHQAFPVDRLLLDAPWMGRRPTVPDSLPIIGPAPRHENLWLAFAHSHLGLTLGPISAVLIANFIGGERQPFSPAAYSPARYL